jgi:hypothetical protein
MTITFRGGNVVHLDKRHVAAAIVGIKLGIDSDPSRVVTWRGEKGARGAGLALNLFIVLSLI